MINLIQIKRNLVLKFSILLIALLISKNLYISKNLIIFKINDKAFTSFDYELRVRYLNFVGSNNDLSKKLIMDDFISANLFYEHYQNSNNKIDIEPKVKEIYKNIIKVNKENKKKFKHIVNEENILFNIRIDYVRKIILESFFNSNINELDTKKDEIDLLYNFKIKYINFNNEDIKEIKNIILNLENINFNTVISVLEKNNVEYFVKEKEIENIQKVNNTIKDKILSNKNFFYIEDINKLSFIFIEKRFETLDGLIADIYSVKSLSKIDENNLKCEKLKNNSNYDIVNKEYKFINLNNDLKNNLVNINDYLIFNNDDNGEIIYIILCDIKFDKEILNNYNLKKFINTNVSKIERNFINKYSKIYKLIMLNV